MPTSRRTRSTTRSKDAIAMLIEDHTKLRKLFKDFQGAGPRAIRRKEDLCTRISRDLETHTHIEESVFYPAARFVVPDLISEGLKEHQAVDKLLMQLRNMKGGDPRFDTTMKELIQNIEHHAGEEEREMFPKLKSTWDANRLRELGNQMARSKAEHTRTRRAAA